MTVPSSGFRRYPCGLLSLRNLLPRGIDTSGMVERTLFCIRHLLSAQIVMLGLNFLAVSFPSGKTPVFRYDIYGIVQLFSEFTSCTFVLLSISEEIWTNDNMCSGTSINSTEVAFASRSAHSFSPLGI